MKINIYFWLMLIFVFGYGYEVRQRQKAVKTGWELVALCKDCNNDWDSLHKSAIEVLSMAKQFKRERDSLIKIQNSTP